VQHEVVEAALVDDDSVVQVLEFGYPALLHEGFVVELDHSAGEAFGFDDLSPPVVVVIKRFDVLFDGEAVDQKVGYFSFI